MTCRELEMHSWNAVQQRDRLLGCSVTGWQDMVNATRMTRDDQVALLRELRETAHSAAAEIADQLGGKRPLLVTTVKPEGTLSLLPTVSSGVHYSHAPYYIRRVRISAADPLCKVCEDLGYLVLPEVGQDPDDPTTKVVEFPYRRRPAGSRRMFQPLSSSKTTRCSWRTMWTTTALSQSMCATTNGRLSSSGSGTIGTISSRCPS